MMATSAGGSVLVERSMLAHWRRKVPGRRGRTISIQLPDYTYRTAECNCCCLQQHRADCSTLHGQLVSDGHCQARATKNYISPLWRSMHRVAMWTPDAFPTLPPPRPSYKFQLQRKQQPWPRSNAPHVQTSNITHVSCLACLILWR